MNWNFITRQNLNIQKWNNLISETGKGLPYAYSWYLDCVAKNWGAFIAEDYKAACPIPYKRNYFLQQTIFQPLFSQQLGIFNKLKLNQSDIDELTQSIKRFAKHGTYHFNFQNTDYLKSLEKTTCRRNSILNLNRTYDEIRSNYSHGLLSSLKKAAKSNIYIDEQVDPSEFVSFYKLHLGKKLKDLKNRHYIQLEKLLLQLQKLNLLRIRIIKNEEKKPICGATFIITSQRIVYLLGFTSKEGRHLNAMSQLDQTIRAYSNKPFDLDFEGSQINSVQQFFDRFGVFHQYYPQWKF